jgi:hypothetical protein
MKLFFLCSGLLLISGCASMTHRGVVAMKVSDSEAHVGAGDNELRMGDHVELYRNVCAGAARETGTRSCEKRSSGHGVVTKEINADYSVVKFDPGVTFSEGDLIEKHAH